MKQQVSREVIFDLPESFNITDMLLKHVNSGKNPILFTRRNHKGEWKEVNAEDFYAQVKTLAKGLIGLGYKHGDRIGLMSKTRYEWSLLDFAILFAGCITVPVYETSSPKQIEWILSDSGTKAIFVENEEHESAVLEVKDQLPELKKIWIIENADFKELAKASLTVSNKEFEERRDQIKGSDIASIVYTSGTTGKPKGCMLMHSNFTGIAVNCSEQFKSLLEYQRKELLFLPLAHVLARLIALMSTNSGINIAHTPNIKSLSRDLNEVKPHFILGVPRVFEKVYNTVKSTAKYSGKGIIFDRAEKVAIQYSKALSSHKKIPFRLRTEQKLFDKLLYSKILDSMGGNMVFACSGGAPLSENMSHFFRGAGLPIVEGYGMTETCAPITFMSEKDLQPGTVGPPIPGVTVGIADDYEILVKGVNVFKGYWKNEEATNEAIRDGWLHTGDLGFFDKNDNIHITGRKKEIIVTAGGKNVIPALLEDRIRAHELISQCVVIGDQRPFISAIISLDAEVIPSWLEHHDLPLDTSLSELVEHPKVIAEVQDAVNDANSTVSHAEAIKKFKVIESDFTEESGHLTPSLKIKRTKVLKDFQDTVDDIYNKR
ncbi:MAG: long-chain fatty acid--CoA ligase [Micrococcaceae bacterium]